MRMRMLAMVAAAAAVGAVLTGPAALAVPTTTATCPAGEMCVWSGTNYTGTMATVASDQPWEGCVSAASLGLPSIRSAQRNGVACQYQASLHADGGCGVSTEPEYVGNQTPTISPAALSLDLFQIPC